MIAFHQLGYFLMLVSRKTLFSKEPNLSLLAHFIQLASQQEKIREAYLYSFVRSCLLIKERGSLQLTQVIPDSIDRKAQPALFLCLPGSKEIEKYLIAQSDRTLKKERKQVIYLLFQKVKVIFIYTDKLFHLYFISKARRSRRRANY